MKSLYPILLFTGLLFSSCSTAYHTYVVAENPDLAYSTTKGFLYEKDSVSVYFTFAGHRMPLNVTVVNESNQAIHLDWNKTSFVVNGYLLPVVNPDSHQDITSLFFESWDGYEFVSLQVSQNSSLPMRYIPPRTKYSFHVRSFPEFEPNPDQIWDVPTLEDGKPHPTSSAIDPTIYKRLEDEYGFVRVILHIQNAERPEIKIPVDQTFFMTQQYKVEVSDGRHGITKYADRGYFIHDDSSESDGMAVASVMTILSGLLLFLIVAADAP